MRKELILKEMDRLICTEHEECSFRKLASNLNIAPSTISYQFNNQENLYREFLKYKLKQIITPESLKSFEHLMFSFGNGMYDLFGDVSTNVTFEMVDTIIGTIVLQNYIIIDQVYEADFGEVNRIKETAIISIILMAMLFPNNYSKILDSDLSIKSNREKFISRAIKREVRL
ncbi:hypothetical protein RZE82_00860 [Mollicutes bacterium LVI A0039]|nr:hypothetical protein RZE82_00860 [Mollicutes bacterium LVI A0039]